MVINRNCDPAVWRQLVKTSPQGNIFADDRFLRSAGLEVELVTIESEGEVIFGCPIAKRQGSTVGKQWPFVQYHGPLLSDKICHLPIHRAAHRQLEAAKVFLEYMEDQCDQIWFNFHHRHPDMRAYSWFHYHDCADQRFQFFPLYTGIVDLASHDSLEQYLAAIRPCRRQDYRKAAKSGHTIVPSKDIEVLDKLHAMTFDRQEIKREGDHVEIMRNICLQALADGYGDLFYAYNNEGTCSSGAFFLHDEHTAYYLIGANDPAHRQTGSSTHLLIDVFWQYRLRGITSMDLVGINSPSRGDYKASLNAAPHLYLQAFWRNDHAYARHQQDSASTRRNQSD